MDQQKDLFIQFINQHDTVLVTGPTGCGKSTFVPSWLCQHFPDTKTLLIQPRRLATANIADRICALNGFQMAREVGFVMGRRYFESPTNRLIVATGGSALNIIMKRPDYYDFIIIDEIHEANQAIEQLLAISNLLQKSYKFKIILMSATVDATAILAQFENSAHFSMQPQPNVANLQVTDVEMMAYNKFDVKLLAQEDFSSLVHDPANQSQKQKYQQMFKDIVNNMAVQVVRILAGAIQPNYKGDILCFVPGMKHIDSLNDQILYLCKKENISNFQIQFMHARFSGEQKNNVANNKDSQVRQIIISTSICETSITLPNLSYVVDSCLTNIFANQSLLTCACSYEAILQRLGRVGRCGPGVYIPCINKEFLELLEANYTKEDVSQSLDTFTLQYYSQFKTNNKISITDLLLKTSKNVTKNQIDSVLSQLRKEGYLNEESITPKGYFSALMQTDLEYCRQLFYASFLQIPIVAVLAIVVDKQSDLQLFVHELEVEQNKDLYKKVKGLQYSNLVQLYAFAHNGTTTNFQCMDPWLSERTFFKCDMMPALKMLARDTSIMHTQNYCEQYANAKVVALWRQYFPVPTEQPTAEEVFWCKQRLLSPQSLREIELETLSTLVKLNGVNQADQLQFIDRNLMQMNYPTTADEIEQFMQENNYQFDKVNYQDSYNAHTRIWELIKAKFTPDYQPALLQFLKAEKDIGKAQLCQLLTLANVCTNGFSTFMYSGDTHRVQFINTTDYMKGKPSNYKSKKEQVSWLLSLDHLKVAGKVGQQIQKQFDQQFQKYLQQMKLCEYTAQIKLAGSKIDSIKIRPQDGQAASMIQMAVSMLFGPQKISLQDLVIEDINKAVQHYEVQKTIIQAHTSIPNLMTLWSEIDDTLDKSESSQNASEQQSDVQESDSGEVVIEIGGDIVKNENVGSKDTLYQKLKNSHHSPGQQFIFNQKIQTLCPNLFRYPDFSIFTCSFYNNNPRTPSYSSAGIATYFISCLMGNQNCHLFVLLDSNKSIHRIILFDICSNSVLFAIENPSSTNKKQNKSIQYIIDLITALSVFCKHFNDKQCCFKQQLFKAETQDTDLTNFNKVVNEKCIKNDLMDDVEQILLQQGQTTARDVILVIFKYFSSTVFVVNEEIAGACMGNFNFSYEFENLSQKQLIDDGYLEFKLYQDIKIVQQE